MPVRRVRGGYRYGRSGKAYASRAKAERQGRAIHASRRRRGVRGYSDRMRWLQ